MNDRVDSGFIINDEERFKTNYREEYNRPNLRNCVLSKAADNVLNHL